MPLREHEIVALGHRSPVAEAGAADAPEAVVLLHGNPGSRLDWLGLLPALGAHARAIAPDLPGYGEADKPDELPYTVPGYAAWLDAALARLGVERVHLAVHDWGGAIGVRWAMDHPERLASLVAINAGGLSSTYRWHGFARALRTPGLGAALQATSTAATFRATLRRTNPLLPVAEIDRMWSHNDRRTRRAALALYRSVGDPGALPREAAPVLAPLDRPALVVWGDRDPFIGPEHAERARDLFPHARIAHLPEGGHWPMLETPETVAGHVEPFLAGVVAASA